MKFLSYQWAFINDPSPLKILEKSRRIGGSFAVAYSAFRKLLAIPNHDVVVVTRDQDTGIEFVRDVHRFGRAWNMQNPKKAIPEACFTKTQFSIPHSQGESRLLMVSSNPNAAAGRGGSLILDEMALHQDPELLLTVAMPVITAGGNVTILSTHRSKNSSFNRLILETKKGNLNFSLHKTTIYDALDAGFLEEVVNPQRKKQGMTPFTREEFISFIKKDVCLGDEARFEQEYLAIPSEQQYQLITLDLLERAVGEPIQSGDCYLGWDIATSESGDYTAIVVISRDQENRCHLVHKWIQKGMELAQQREKIKELVKLYKVKKLCLDATGIGTDSAQILEQWYGEWMCEGVKFTTQSKEEMASRMLDCFQSESIIIPDDPQLIKDINSVEKIYGKGERVRYEAPRLDGSHGDQFWALGLALRAAGWKKQSGEIKILNANEHTQTNIDRMLRNMQEDKKVHRRAF